MATVSVPPVFVSARDDAMQLYRAFKGFGCDTAAVVNILAHRDATQRALIEQEYRSIYSDNLKDRLASELSGDVKRAVVLWMPDPAARDATIVRTALRGSYVDISAATEVICSRTSAQLHVIKQVYHEHFNANIEKDIEFRAVADHRKLLLAYINTIRHERPEVDHEMVQHDAKALYKAGEKRLGTDEKTFIHIFSERNRAHLTAVASAYRSMYGTSLKKVLKSETSSFFKTALVTILQCAENPGKHFAKVLHNAMKGIGTNDTALMRVITSWAEIDLHYIKHEYQKKYHKSLIDAVHSETSSHYRDFLLSLLGATHR